MKERFEKIVQWGKEHPLIAIGLIAGVVLLAIFFKRNSGGGGESESVDMPGSDALSDLLSGGGATESPVSTESDSGFSDFLSGGSGAGIESLAIPAPVYNPEPVYTPPAFSDVFTYEPPTFDSVFSSSYDSVGAGSFLPSSQSFADSVSLPQQMIASVAAPARSAPAPFATSQPTPLVSVSPPSINKAIQAVKSGPDPAASVKTPNTTPVKAAPAIKPSAGGPSGRSTPTLVTVSPKSTNKSVQAVKTTSKARVSTPRTLLDRE